MKISFLDHGVNRKVVDNVENYPNMKFQPKLIKNSTENGQKQQKKTFFDEKLLIKSLFVSVLVHFYIASYCRYEAI